MTRRASLLIGVLVAGAFAATGNVAARAPLGVRPPITVVASVEGADGSPVPGLNREDFELLVDGQARPIESCQVASTPLSVVLLIDISASMRVGDLMSGFVLQRAVEQWFPVSLRPGDRARIGVIARGVRLSPKFTADRHEQLEAVAVVATPTTADRQGPSPIWDAVDEAASALEWEGGQRAIIVFTDGRSNGNRVSVRDAAAHAATIGASVHVIAERDAPQGLRQSDGSLETIAPGLNLRWLTDATGGSYRSDKRFPWNDPGPLIGRVLGDLHQSYTLGFADDGDGRHHTLEVRTRTADLTVRARRSYLASYGTTAEPPPGGGR